MEKLASRFPIFALGTNARLGVTQLGQKGNELWCALPCCAFPGTQEGMPQPGHEPLRLASQLPAISSSVCMCLIIVVVVLRQDPRLAWNSQSP